MSTTRHEIQDLVEAILCSPVSASDPALAPFFARADSAERFETRKLILACGAVEAQVLLHAAWTATFGLPPTPLEVRGLYRKVYGPPEQWNLLPGSGGSAIGKDRIADAVISMARSSSVARFLGPDAMDEVKRRVQGASLTAHELKPRRDAIVARLSHGLLDVRENSSLQEIVKLRRAVDCEIEIENPLTGLTFDSLEDPGVRLTPGERIRYAMVRDTFFQGVKMHGQTLTLVLDDESSSPVADIIKTWTLDILHSSTTSNKGPIIWARLQGQQLQGQQLQDQLQGQQLQDHLNSKLNIHNVSGQRAILDLLGNIPRRFKRSVVIATGAQSRSFVKNHARAVFCCEENSGRRILITDSTDSFDSSDVVAVVGHGDHAVPPSLTPRKIRILPRNLLDPDAPRWMRDLARTALQSHLLQNEPSGDSSSEWRSIFLEFVTRLSSTVESRLPRIAKESRNNNLAVVAIDTRENPMTVAAVVQTLSCLDFRSWDALVVTNSKSAHYYDGRDSASWRVLAHGIDQGAYDSTSLRILERSTFDIEDYNTLLTSPGFWRIFEQLGYEKVLLVQDDGFLVRKGLDSMISGVGDYIGAPWSDAPFNQPLKHGTGGKLVGNGGLSLRSVRAMIRVAETRPRRIFHTGLHTEPEDVFFAVGVSEDPDLTLASNAAARAFATEQEICMTSLGFHKPWPYHPKDRVLAFFNSVLADAAEVHSLLADVESQRTSERNA
jgi:hypothetical protein